jgi:hypothetical protein
LGYKNSQEHQRKDGEKKFHAHSLYRTKEGDGPCDRLGKVSEHPYNDGNKRNLSGGPNVSDMNSVLQALGRIEGKVDEIKDSAKEHRDDDRRRFSEVYEKLGEHDQEIAKAKGAKGVILWLIGGGGVALGGLAVAAAKALGH